MTDVFSYAISSKTSAVSLELDGEAIPQLNRNSGTTVAGEFWGGFYRK